jgi:(1->4)-alpha-D-glucan 1-alpha-D-glucosylmutase
MEIRNALTSTYRLQFGPHLAFADATRIVPYLAALGVSDCYSSPLLKSASGSEHGYDVCDHRRLNPALGTERDFDVFTSALRGRQMGLVLDFVPNHMGLDPEANRWWHDVLEHGRSSPYADYFDIDWDPITPELENRILLPILNGLYGEVLHRGELQLEYSAGSFRVRYGERRLPVDPRSVSSILGGDRAHAAPRQAETGDADCHEYERILSALEALPPASSRRPVDRKTRRRTSRAARNQLATLVERSPAIRRRVDAALSHLNGIPGRRETFDALHDLLEQQPYRLAHWKTASDEINYRRFFDINDLGALRMESARVFDATHQRILELVAAGKVTGLRIDHPDGLLDPGSYFIRLQREIAALQSSREGADAQPPARFYVVAEKILADGESLPPGWPIAGTTGYGFLNLVNGLFVDADNAAAFMDGYGSFTGRHETFAEVAHRSRRLVMSSSLASELAVLTRALKAIARRDRDTRDFTLTALRKAIIEVVACLPVYRTYVTAEGFSVNDRETIDFAIDRARQRNPVIAPALFLFIRNVLLASDQSDGLRRKRRFAMRFQQFSAPVAAKGVEDTAFYRHTALLSLNEVGGNPSRFGRSLEEFHAANQVRAAQWPLELLASSTHDSKRGEDTRARLNVLSEIPDAWWQAVGEWQKQNAIYRTAVDREWAPQPNDECFFYQTLIGTWPADALDDRAPEEFVTRLRVYMEKAIREAKTRTSWMNQNTAYEDAVLRFVESTLTGSSAPAFLAAFQPLLRQVAAAGMVNSLAQLVLKLAAPGVSDFYQGTETWQLEMADPDNRRPIDFRARQSMLDGLMPWILRVEDIRRRGGGPCDGACEVESHVRTLVDGWADARIKMFLTACGLRLRREEGRLFIAGEYVPLAAKGSKASHLITFARRHEGKSVIAAVPRLISAFVGSSGHDPKAIPWDDTRVIVGPPEESSRFVHVFTGARLTPVPGPDGSAMSAAELFRTCPVALLAATG